MKPTTATVWKVWCRTSRPMRIESRPRIADREPARSRLVVRGDGLDHIVGTPDEQPDPEHDGEETDGVLGS